VTADAISHLVQDQLVHGLLEPSLILLLLAEVYIGRNPASLFGIEANRTGLLLSQIHLAIHLRQDDLTSGHDHRLELEQMPVLLGVAVVEVVNPAVWVILDLANVAIHGFLDLLLAWYKVENFEVVVEGVVDQLPIV
jgi:hypothetical protein